MGAVGLREPAAQDLIARARIQGVRLLADREQLHISFRGPRPAELLEQLKLHKHAIIATLRGLPLCVCCGHPIEERLETWWGPDRAHRACTEAAFQAEKARGAYLPKQQQGKSM